MPTVGVVGLGAWGPNMLRVLAERTDVHVSWICDLDPGRLERFRHRYPSVQITTDVQHLLDDEQLDSIVLATPVFTHHDLADCCIRAGKHVFVERPLAPSLSQATALTALAAERGKLLMCGQTLLYSPPVRAVRELIASGELGELYFISASRVNLGLHLRDVSVIWDLGPPDFSILRFWLDAAPAGIRATGRDSILPGIADVAFVTMDFDDGLIANVELSWLAPSKLRRTVVVGSRKMVVYEDGGAEALKLYDRGVEFRDPETFGEWHLSYRTGDILTPKLSNEEPLALELAAFVGAIRTGRPPDLSIDLALDVVRITEAADWSLRRDGERIWLADTAVAANESS